ncbi:DUF7482 domain-containing protein [Rheinheimera sp.]|uniref:DUF7482 domain-containing protein n=1 Tax=Rheinheimera sp. TaxID=1869214 RepID=UPI0040473333|tara:strand:- start:10244 stop:10828 length:585 start_codon:yes stop_codon:yes gene_type:complete
MFKIKIRTATLSKACLLASVALIGSTITANAFADNDNRHHGKPLSVTLPLVKGWYDGEPVLYLTTDASDPNAAKDMGVNYVPQLAYAINSQPSSVDDIFAVTNFKQGNIIPSAPIPSGPDNQDTDYTPLWQVSTVTWKDAQQAHTLKSEQDVLDAKANGMVVITQTNIVVNCPVIYSPEGGFLPNTKINGMKIR